MIIIGI
jgi:hypothetical protein